MYVREFVACVPDLLKALVLTPAGGPQMSISAWARLPGAAMGQVKAARRGCFCSCCPEQHPQGPIRPVDPASWLGGGALMARQLGMVHSRPSTSHGAGLHLSEAETDWSLTPSLPRQPCLPAAALPPRAAYTLPPRLTWHRPATPASSVRSTHTQGFASAALFPDRVAVSSARLAPSPGGVSFRVVFPDHCQEQPTPRLKTHYLRPLAPS